MSRRIQKDLPRPVGARVVFSLFATALKDEQFACAKISYQEVKVKLFWICSVRSTSGLV